MNKTPPPQKMFFQTIADQFENMDNEYDISRRKEVVFYELLAPRISLENKLTLDVGCGYGAFSEILAQNNCRLVSCDIVQKLVKKTLRKTHQAGLVLDALRLPFETNTCDMVLSSEMVEHTEFPHRVITELVRVIKPGGYLVITTPNKVWQPVVRMASLVQARNFNGLENFLGYKELERVIRNSGMEILAHIGLHLWPFQIKSLWSLSKKADHWFGSTLIGRVMINQAVIARKKE